MRKLIAKDAQTGSGFSVENVATGFIMTTQLPSVTVRAMKKRFEAIA